eukprot:6488488-Amphidinium_carterae.1
MHDDPHAGRKNRQQQANLALHCLTHLCCCDTPSRYPPLGIALYLLGLGWKRGSCRTHEPCRYPTATLILNPEMLRKLVLGVGNSTSGEFRVSCFAVLWTAMRFNGMNLG